MLLVLTIVHILVIEQLKLPTEQKMSLCIILVLIFFRCFLSLQIFKAFTAVVGIIIRILFRLGPLLTIVLLFYVGTSLMFLSLQTEMESLTVFRDMYYWTIFGGIDDNAFELSLSGIPIVFGTCIISILLMNILIAYLSNEYSRLEDRQVIENLQTKAILNLDIEIVVGLFKYLFSKRFRDSIQFRHDEYFRLMNRWNSGSETEEVRGFV